MNDINSPETIQITKNNYKINIWSSKSNNLNHTK